MVLGTYIGAKRPSYFRLEFDLIESPQWKSFFIQRVLVFHNHLKSKGKRKLDHLLGTFDITRNVKLRRSPRNTSNLSRFRLLRWPNQRLGSSRLQQASPSAWGRRACSPSAWRRRREAQERQEVSGDSVRPRRAGAGTKRTRD